MLEKLQDAGNSRTKYKIISILMEMKRWGGYGGKNIKAVP